MNTAWHIPADELRRYAAGEASPPWLWSTEAHLAGCAHCRQRLGEEVAPQLVRRGWARLDVELDAPQPGWVERVLLRLGVRDHTARLLAATPVLRASWLLALAVTLALTALAANLATTFAVPIVFLGLAPVLPLAGVAVSFGPRTDPTYEITLVAPLHTFRLLLLRTTAVVGATTTMSAVASLALPGYGLLALAWFLPALVLTLLSLALTPRLGPIMAAGSVGAGWLLLLCLTVRPDTGGSVVFAPAGQVALALAAATAAAVVLRLRPHFETGRHFGPAGRFRPRRNP